MKRSFLFSACLAAVLLGATALAQPGYQIKGTITGAGDTWAYLGTVERGKYRNVDSVRVQQGVFTFRGKVAEPNLYAVRLRGQQYLIFLILENQEITVRGQAGEGTGFTVTGSPLTDEYLAYEEKYTQPGRMEIIANGEKAQALRARGDTTGFKEWSAKNIQVVDRLLFTATEHIAAHPESFQSLMLLYNARTVYGPGERKKMLSSLAPQWQQHSLAREITAGDSEQEIYAERGKTGAPFADFRLPDVNGKPVDLASFRGKYVLIDFWASWCKPCRQENPHLVKAYHKFKGKPFEIVGVSLDEKKENWVKAIAKDGLPWVHLSNLKGWENDLVRHYGINGIPSSFLLDPEGKIIARDLRGDALDKVLSQLFE